MSELVNSSNSRAGRAPPTGAAAQLKWRLRREAEGHQREQGAEPILAGHGAHVYGRITLDAPDLVWTSGPGFTLLWPRRCRRRGQAGLSV